jgi:ElaB/YqjD/DUF883 family membrane-anchored ribosome-binding protein
LLSASRERRNLLTADAFWTTAARAATVGIFLLLATGFLDLAWGGRFRRCATCSTRCPRAADDVGLKIQVTAFVQPVLAFLTPAIGELLVFLASLFFFLMGRDHLRRHLVLLFGSQETRLRALRILNDIEDNLTRYIATAGAINIGVGVIVALASYLIGLPNAAMWGAVAFALNFLPYVGPMIMAVTLYRRRPGRISLARPRADRSRLFRRAGDARGSFRDAEHLPRHAAPHRRDGGAEPHDSQRRNRASGVTPVREPFTTSNVVFYQRIPVIRPWPTWEKIMASRRKKNGLTAVDDLRDDLQSLREDIARLADQVGNSVAETGDDALGEAKAQLRRIKDNMDAIISGAGEKGREAGEAVRDVADNFTDAIEESLHTRPLTTLAMAIGVGIVVGATWRR